MIVYSLSYNKEWMVDCKNVCHDYLYSTELCWELPFIYALVSLVKCCPENHHLEKSRLLDPDNFTHNSFSQFMILRKYSKSRWEKLLIKVGNGGDITFKWFSSSKTHRLLANKIFVFVFELRYYCRIPDQNALLILQQEDLDRID